MSGIRRGEEAGQEPGAAAVHDGQALDAQAMAGPWFEHLPLPAFACDPAGRVLALNRAFLAAFGADCSLPAAAPTAVSGAVRLTVDGREVDLHVTRTASGHLVGTAVDVTDREMARRDLGRDLDGARDETASARRGLEFATEKLDEACRHARLGYWDYAIGDGVLSWSPEAFAVYGQDPATFTPTFDNLLSILHPDDRPRYGNLLEEVVGNPKRVYAEHRALGADGRLRYVSVSCAPRFDESGRLTHMFGVMLDTTERAEAAAALASAKQRLEEAQRTGHLGYWEYGIHTGELVLNREAYDIWGQHPDDFRPSFDNLLAILHPDDRVRFGTMVEGVIGNPKRVYFEYRVIDPLGEVRFVTSSCAPRFDTDGRLSHVFGVMLDTTERAKAQAELQAAKDRAERAYAELQAAQDSLVQSEKMASLGQLVAGVAHEINGPVGVALTTASHLQGRTDDLRRQFASGAMTRSALTGFLAVAEEACELLVTNTERIGLLVQMFKQVAADQTGDERRVFYVKEYIEDVLLSLSTQIGPSGHRVKLDCPVALQMESYPGALARVLTHLVRNALQHAFRPEQHGLIGIAVRVVDDEWIEIHHSDNGQGIAEPDLHRIFDPFFTTARHAGCVGLGLHIAYNLTTQTLGGTLTAESIIGDGTTFLLRLPRHAPGAAYGD